MDKNSWESIKKEFNFTGGHWRNYLILLVDVALVVVSWQLSFSSPLALVLSYALLILALLHFYILLHEATHSTLSNRIFINNLIGQVLGMVILLPYLPRQTSHILHHTWTGHPKRDPANKRAIQKFSVVTEKQIKQLEFVWKYWIPIFIINDRVGLWRSPFQQRAQGLKSKRVKSEMQWVYIYVGLFFAFAIFFLRFGLFKHFLIWYVPSLFVALILEELVNLPHHAETPLLNAYDKALPYWEQHKVTHSCEDVSVWSKFVLLNFNFHTAHHLYPNAPWYQLRSLHEKILEVSPEIVSGHQTTNELEWSMVNRKRPLLSIMGHYFNKTASRT
jgi:fatty acid desaturase